MRAFSRKGARLCIYQMFVWSNLNFLHISQWITFPTQSCLAFIIIIIIIIIKRSRKRNVTAKSRKIRLMGEKETYKYLGILEAATNKEIKIKSKLRKYISDGQENVSKPNLAVESRQRKKKHLGCSPCKDTRGSSWNEQGRPLTNEQEIRKLMTMHNALHPRDDIERL